jgi:hypothetical protein
MYYFKITEENVDFVTEINGGVKPQVKDENGEDQYYVVNLNDEPNEILSKSAFRPTKEIIRMRDVVRTGTRIIFIEGLG